MAWSKFFAPGPPIAHNIQCINRPWTEEMFFLFNPDHPCPAEQLHGLLKNIKEKQFNKNDLVHIKNAYSFSSN